MCVRRAVRVVTVNRMWIPAQPSLASMGAPAVVTWAAMCVSVQLAILVTVVRMMWMSVLPSPARMEAPVLILWPTTSVPVPLAHWEFSVRSMRMTVAQAHPWTQASGAYTTAPVWTWWVAFAVTVPRDTQACTVRQTSMSVVRVPVMQHIPGTAYKIQVVNSAASAILASQGLAVRLLCPHVSPSRVSMEASAVPA